MGNTSGVAILRSGAVPAVGTTTSLLDTDVVKVIVAALDVEGLGTELEYDDSDEDHGGGTGRLNFIIGGLLNSRTQK
jgi:hypothetical protein